MTNKIQVKIVRQAKPYCFMWDASTRYGSTGLTAETGWFWDCFAALTFAAFAVEGYLNHLGEAIYADWGDLDRLDPMSKLRFLCRFLKLEFNIGARPHQTVHQLFRFRNQIAHPRSEEVVEERRMATDDYRRPLDNLPKTDWEEFVTKERFTRVYEDVHKVLSQLHAAADRGTKGDFLFSEGGFSGLAQLIEEEADARHSQGAARPNSASAGDSSILSEA